MSAQSIIGRVVTTPAADTVSFRQHQFLGLPFLIQVEYLY